MALPDDSPWRACLRRQRFLLTLWAGAIPVFVVFAQLLGAFGGGSNPHLFIPLALVLAVPFAVAHAALLSFKCPRCAKPFFKKRLFSYNNFFRTHCVHCRLPKWTEGTANKPSEPTR